jgi:hypothetical protein
MGELSAAAGELGILQQCTSPDRAASRNADQTTGIS